MTAHAKTIMALDLATRTGFAIGEVGQSYQPNSGTVRFASEGASQEAVFAGAIAWFSEAIRIHEPDVIVWEAPLATSFNRGKTNSNTTGLLWGLPAIVGGVAYLRNVYTVYKAETRLVRKHFIGGNPKRNEAKTLTMRQCRAIGWSIEDDNEADALAIWHYMCSVLAPKIVVAPTPLFLTKAARR